MTGVGPAPLDPSPSVETEPKPLTVIVPGSTAVGQYLRDLGHFRGLIWVLAVRDIKLRYRQTALGASWVVIQPLLSAGVLGFVFGKVARLPTDGIPTFLFVFCGMVAFSCFTSAAGRAAGSLLGNTGLVSKIYFPRLVLPFSTAVSVLLDLLVSSCVLAVLLFTTGVTPGAGILLLPVWLLLLLALAQGFGAAAASVSVRYRDVQQIVPVVLQLMLYASPVAYSVRAIPARYQDLYHLNPVAALLEAFRWSVLGTPFPGSWYLAYSATVCVATFVVGALVLERMEKTFADVI